MLRVVMISNISLAILALAPAAHAACPAPEPHIATQILPVGCTLSVYLVEAGKAPKAFALRGDARIDVTGGVTSEAASVPIFIEEDACTGEGMDGDYPVTHYRITLAGAIEGDIVVVDDIVTGAANVVAAAACPTPIEPSSLYCADDTPETCDGEGGSPAGCATHPGGGLAFGLVALACARRRRRDRERSAR